MTIQTIRSFAENARAGRSNSGAVIHTSLGAKAAPGEGRIIRFVASDETVDRMGDIIRVSGWKLANFKRNPVILWQHNRDQMPVGKAMSIGVEGKALVASVEFAPASVNPLAEQAYQAYKSGYLSAVSVGFAALKWRWLDESDPSNLGMEFLEQELHEFSAVTVPANPNALVTGERSADGATEKGTQPIVSHLLHLLSRRRRFH